MATVAEGRVDALPTGLARLVELARALATRPRVILLDEPASGLDDAESESFADLLLSLAADGMAVLLVEHDVRLVMQVCQLIHVLDFGAILAVGSPQDIQDDQRVLDAYLGAAVDAWSRLANGLPSLNPPLRLRLRCRPSPRGRISTGCGRVTGS